MSHPGGYGGRMKPDTPTSYGVNETRHAIARRIQAATEETENAAPTPAESYEDLCAFFREWRKRQPKPRARCHVWSRHR